MLFRRDTACSYLSTVALFVFASKFVGLSTTHEATVSGADEPTSLQLASGIPHGIQPSFQLVLGPGDAIASVTKFYDNRGISAIKLTTDAGDSVTCGRTTEDMITESVPPGTMVCGLSIKTKRSAIKDVSLRLSKAPSLNDLNFRLTRLRVSNAKSAIKNDALVDALCSAADRVTAIHTRAVVSAAPLVATLIAMCDDAKKQIRPRHRALWRTRRDRSLALVRIHEDLEKLLALVLRFEENEASRLMDSQATNGDRTTLRTFVDQTITADNASRFVALHDLHPMPLLEYRTTDRLVTYLIESGNVSALEQVASKHASALDTTVPRAMASLAERVPAIRLAIANGQVPSLCWLMGVACLEPLDPPPAPSPLSICGLPASPMELANGMDAGPARGTILLLLNRVDRRRRFVANWAALAKRTDEPITQLELFELVDDITQVRELQPLQLLAASSLVLDEQRGVFLAAVKHAIDHHLVLYDGALWLFVSQLSSARDGGLISTDEYEKLKWDAQKIDVASAPCIQELQGAVGALQLSVANLNTHTTSLQQELTSLRLWAVSFQREAVESAKRERIVAMVVATLAVFGGPVFNAIGNCINVSDATHLLSTLVGPEIAGVGTSLVEALAGSAFHSAIEGAVTRLSDDSHVAVSALSVATINPQPPVDPVPEPRRRLLRDGGARQLLRSLAGVVVSQSGDSPGDATSRL